MATQPEKSHSTHTVFTFHYDKKDLKDASTASTTFQGVKLTVLPRTRARVPECSLRQWQAEGEWNRSLPFFHHEREGTSLARKYNSLLRKNFKGNPSSACTLQVQAHKESNLQLKFNLKVMKEGTGTKGRVTEPHWLFQLLGTKSF